MTPWRLVLIAVAISLTAIPGLAGFASVSFAQPNESAAKLWVQRYDGSGNGDDSATSVAVSPDGSRVFVTGGSPGKTSADDYATIAYSSTGLALWEMRYNGPQNSSDVANSLVVSPDGSTVYVTGQSGGPTAFFNYATIRYDASTGSQVWVSRYDGPGTGNDEAFSAAVSPDGAIVFVTGVSAGSTSDDYATIAYDASTGAELWVSRYAGPGGGNDDAFSLAVSPDGTKAFVTGFSFGATGQYDYATVAYDTATGATLWVRRYDSKSHLDDEASSLVVAPDGTKVFVTGYSDNPTSHSDYTTVAYDATSGTGLWVRRYNGTGNLFDLAKSVAVSPDSTRVIVTGKSYGGISDDDIATIAYDSSSGGLLWLRRYNGPGNGGDEGNAATASADGTKVFVTGDSLGPTSGPDYTTIAYDINAGSRVWVRRYNGDGNGIDIATSVAATRDGSKLFVTGLSVGPEMNFDYATIAYTTG